MKTPTTTQKPAPSKPARKRTPRANKGEKPAFSDRVKEELKAENAQREEEKQPYKKELTYTKEKAEEILERIATGESLRSICSCEGFPSRNTFFRWMYRIPELRDQYAWAKEVSGYADEEELHEIADDGTNDWMEIHSKEGDVIGYKVNGEHVQRSKLRVETRRWLLERKQPKRFGNKIDLNHGGQVDNPITALIKQVSGASLKPVEDSHE